MQSSLNVAAFERKISQVYDLIEVGDLKKAMRQVNTLLDKNSQKMHQIERLYYRIVKCYVLDKSNRRSEAFHDIEEIVKEILESKINDQQLLEQADVIMQEIGCYEKLLVLREKLQQLNPNDKQTAIKLFTQYTFMNEYQKMSGMANKIAMSFQEKEFALYSIQALYMLSQTKGASPMSIDLALAFIEKQRQTHYKDDIQPSVPQYFVQLYFKILLAKKQFDKALEYLNQHEQSFGMILDKRRLVYQLKYKQGDIIGVIQELISIIKHNYQHVDEFQSIYDHHELLISLVVDQLKLKNIVIDKSYIENLDSQENIPLEEENTFKLFDLENHEQSLKNLYGSFKKYQSLHMENKTTNYHNCRKSAILSQLLLKNKIMIRLFENEVQINSYIEEGIQSYKNQIQDYAIRYIELNSMVFDLYPFIPFLNKNLRHQLSEEFQNQVEQIQDPVRRGRATINLHKLRKVLGLYNETEEEKLKEIVTQIHEEYFRLVQLDGKPEKGERKLADDLVVVINELLEPLDSTENDSNYLYRITLLEFALEKSPYNFDIALALLKIYDKQGLSTSFNQVVQSLGLKGVQLESMGFLVLRHAVDFRETNLFKSFTLKYNKYSKMNSKNLKECKMKALTELNFDQIENFIEYEDYLNNSYFAQVMKSLSQMIELGENIKTQQEYYKSFFENMSGQLDQESSILLNFESDQRKKRTQDLKIVQHQFDVLPEFGSFKKPEQSWRQEFEKDMMMKEITKDDKIYSYYKYDRKSNYKENMTNSLGVLELSETFSMIHGLFNLLGQIQTQKDKVKIIQLIEQFQVQKEVYEKYLSEKELGSRQDIGDVYLRQIESVNKFLNYSIQILELIKRLNTIEKKEGQPGEEVIQKLLAVKDLVEQIKSKVPFGQSTENRQLFLQVFLSETLLPILFDLLSDTLKALIPSSKKKKKGDSNQAQDDLNNHIVNPLKQLIKDLSAYFQSPAFLYEIDYFTKRDLHLKSLANSNDLLKLQTSEQNLSNILNRKLTEIVKEEKLARDRLKENAINVSKRFKEISSNGAFQ
eukprot:403336110